MNEIDFFQVDAFASKAFAGNAAAVTPLPLGKSDPWWDDKKLLTIAQENNLSETAFLRRVDEAVYDLRWFTPVQEVPLCGHATLAAAHTLWRECGVAADRLTFNTKSGALTVEKDGAGYAMDFPADNATPAAPMPVLSDALGAAPAEIFKGQYILAVFESAQEVLQLSPDMSALVRFADDHGALAACVVATARGGSDWDGAPADFISRFFAPAQGIPEDPVTGSAHCLLAPFWAERLGNPTLQAFQASKRGGRVGCRVAGERVILSGEAVTVISGRMTVPF